MAPAEKMLFSMPLLKRSALLPLLLVGLAGRQLALQLDIAQGHVDVALLLVAAAYLMLQRWRDAEEKAAFERHFPVMRHGYLQQHIFQGQE